jgi:hypothetical protein
VQEAVSVFDRDDARECYRQAGIQGIEQIKSVLELLKSKEVEDGHGYYHGV